MAPIYYANNLPSTIEIGYTGEKDFREIWFDVRDWYDEMPSGIPGIVYKRPNGSVRRMQDFFPGSWRVKWTVSDEDVGQYTNSKEGVGELQLEMFYSSYGVRTKVRKSKVVRVLVNQGLNYWRG